MKCSESMACQDPIPRHYGSNMAVSASPEVAQSTLATECSWLKGEELETGVAEVVLGVVLA